MINNIYSIFSEEIKEIKETVIADTKKLPKSLYPLVEYYLTKRLLITHGNSSQQIYDPHIGRPVPYAVYWFSDALGLKDQKIINKLALAMVYSSIATTIRDDIVDGETNSCADCFRLYKVFNCLYLGIFINLFKKKSQFWYILAESDREHDEYERWVMTQNGPPEIDPYSDPYLLESSRYFTAVVFPSLAATALLSGNPTKVDRIRRFLLNYGCGWRIFDDLDDWMIDVAKNNYNNSTLLHSIQREYGKSLKLTPNEVWCMFLDKRFIEKTTNTMLKYFHAARREILPLKNGYLTKFIDDQINVQYKLEQFFSIRSTKFYEDIAGIIEKGLKSNESKPM